MNDNVYDVLIIGSGIAGLTCALSIDSHYSVAICSKTILKSGATLLAQGGIAAVVAASDTHHKHIEDTLIAGDYHNDRSTVGLVSTESKRAVDWLDSLGVPFDKDMMGNYLVSLEAAHSSNRIVHATDFTGREIEQTLVETVLKKKNIKAFENFFCIDLVVKDGKSIGATFFNHGHTYTLFAKKIVIASGGLGQIYEWTTNPTVATGDGVAIAHRAGGKVKDLEFIQFHPTALKIGESPLFLLSETLRGEGAHIVNELGKRFLLDTLVKGELAPRDKVSRSIFEEMKTSNVFLDMRHVNDKKVRSRFPNIYKTLLDSYQLDLTHDLIPITPSAHYSCGGVVTDIYGKTSIRNLYAVGEVAYTGLHGANRLASNSLLEGVVFGIRAGKSINISSLLSRSSSPFVIPSDPPVGGKGSHPSKKVIQQYETLLKKIMWDYVGIVRTKKGLLLAKKEVQVLKEKIMTRATQTVPVLELRNMIDASLLIIDACLRRKNSLGAHFLQ